MPASCLNATSPQALFALGKYKRHDLTLSRLLWPSHGVQSEGHEPALDAGRHLEKHPGVTEISEIVHCLSQPDVYPAALATLVTVRGSSYRRPGARLLLTAQGARTGSISGGCLEEDVLQHARTVLATGKPVVVTYDTTEENDLLWGVGLGCHGVVEIFIERLSHPPVWVGVLRENQARRQTTRLWVRFRGGALSEQGTHLAGDGRDAPLADVFDQSIRSPVALHVLGAGDDARPLVQFASQLGWRVTVADPRSAFATAARFPLAHRVAVMPAAVASETLAPDSDSAAVIMTHHYVHDLPLLGAVLPLPYFYVGLLGPRKRAERLLGDLASKGCPITSAQRARLHGPVGLDLGSDAPEAVAVAIIAEILAIRNARDARPLRDRALPIHQ
ncbi:MAG: XdhC family protein [Opitutaceae bacterium]|nr:XdhC family protein [Opitutaceae bacterium]